MRALLFWCLCKGPHVLEAPKGAAVNILDSRTIFGLDWGFYVRTMAAYQQSHFLGSTSFGLTRNIDRSSCMVWSELLIRGYIRIV